MRINGTGEWDPRCAANHFGVWCIEPTWFSRAVAAVKSGTWKVQAATGDGDGEPFYAVDGNGLAHIFIAGSMMKGQSKFGGTSTLATRALIRGAVRDADVRGIMLTIDSPGGTAAGTPELGDEIVAARRSKPVFAHIDDLGASAAYWAGSQAERLTANRNAMVGSIGTMAILEDTSKRDEMEGVEVRVVRSGPRKAMGADGKVTPELEEDVQKFVDDNAAMFFETVRRGRKMTEAQVGKVSDGSVFTAPEALSLRLIDAVESRETAIAAAMKAMDETERASRAKTRARRNAELRIAELEA